MVIHGHRVKDNILRDNPFRPGAFGHVDIGGEQHRWQWWCVTPNGHVGNLDLHDVTEHEDGMITVSPSILIEDHTGELWHGWLEHGDWRKC